MRPIPAAEYPPDVEEIYRRARRLERVTLAYIASAAVFLYVTMGISQAMRTSFFEDVISLVPAAAFLVGTTIARRNPVRISLTAPIARLRSPISSPRSRSAGWGCFSSWKR